MGKLSDNTKGALFMMVAMAAFAGSDATTKRLLDDLPIYQMLFLRGALMIVLIPIFLTRVAGPLSFKIPPQDRVWIALRSLFEVGCSVTILRALALMPLGNVTAVLQASAFVIAIAGVLLFREKLGWRRLLAISIGFIGVLLIVKPGPAGFNAGAIWAILGMLFVAARDLSVRNLSEGVSTSTVTLSAAIALTVFTGALSLGETYAPVGFLQWRFLLLGSVLILVAFACSIAAMRTGEISVVTPFRYTALIWALLLGFWAFGDWPDAWALAGVVIIAAAGVFTVLREARMRRLEAEDAAQ